MQTNFTAEQLRDPDTAVSNQVLRTCVHCGFCTATCPTFVLLGDELDSPRGRIYLIKDMLEADRPATEEVVLHVDRCLTCLSCMTTCPSGVHYMHLVDHARHHIERTYRRPWHGPAAARRVGNAVAAPLIVPRRAAGRPADAATEQAGARQRHAVATAARDAVDDAAQLAAAVRAGASGRASGAGRAARARGIARRLRPAGAGARDQRRDDPLVESAGRRSGGAQGQRLLRCAESPHGSA